MRPLVEMLVDSIAGAAIILAVAACFVVAQVPKGHAGAPRASCAGQTGIASWYGTESGNRTASGAYFDGSSMTAAMPHRSMMGKRVRVTDMRTGRSVVVLVNDLGPAAWTLRVIDLSRAAARGLGMGGLAPVCLEVIK